MNLDEGKYSRMVMGIGLLTASVLIEEKQVAYRFKLVEMLN